MRILGKSGTVLAIRGGGAATALVLTVLLGRLLGPSQFGILSVGLGFFSVLSTLCRGGLDYVLLREVSRSHTRGAERAAISILARGLRFGSLAGLGCAAVLIAFRHRLATVFDMPSLSTVLIGMAAAIPIHTVMWLHAEGLKGLRRPERAAGAQYVLFNLGTLLLFLALGGTLDAASWSPALGAALALFVTLSATPTVLKPVGEADGPSLSRLLRSARPLWIVAGVNMIIMWSDVVMLGWLGDPAETGRYAGALKLAGMVSFVLVAVAAVVSPILADRAAAKDKTGLWTVFRHSAIVAALLSLPATIIGLSYPDLIMSLLGASFTPAQNQFRVLIIGQGLHAVLGLGGYLLVMADREASMRNWVIVAAVVNICGNLLLIPRFGGMGAAIATSFSIILMDAGILRNAWNLRAARGVTGE